MTKIDTLLTWKSFMLLQLKHQKIDSTLTFRVNNLWPFSGPFQISRQKTRITTSAWVRKLEDHFRMLECKEVQILPQIINYLLQISSETKEELCRPVQSILQMILDL